MGDEECLAPGDRFAREIDEGLEAGGVERTGLAVGYVAGVNAVFEEDGVDARPIVAIADDLANGAVTRAPAAENDGMETHRTVGRKRFGGLVEERGELRGVLEGLTVNG